MGSVERPPQFLFCSHLLPSSLYSCRDISTHYLRKALWWGEPGGGGGGSGSRKGVVSDSVLVLLSSHKPGSLSEWMSVDILFAVAAWLVGQHASHQYICVYLVNKHLFQISPFIIMGHHVQYPCMYI